MHCSLLPPLRKLLLKLFALALALTILLIWVLPALAQSNSTATNGVANALTEGATFVAPIYWYLLASALAMLMPVGFVLIGVAGLETEQAWNAALGGLAAIGLAIFAYWAVGFALQFGGVGLIYPQAGLRNLVWEWSPLPSSWGTGWGAAGLSGWLLAGPEITPLAYALFLAHLPWVMTTALLPSMALRGRAPTSASFLLALLIGGLLYPLPGNWVQGGGWLSALGRNINLGHGMVDIGGAGTVHLVAAGFTLAALAVWAPKRPRRNRQELPLPPAFQPLLAVVGSLLVMAGALGWLWANPLQVSTLGELPLLRGSVNLLLCAGAGTVVPLIYTWFVGGQSHPTLGARGLVAGVVAGLAVAPFVQPGVALFTGLVAGASVPLATYVVEGLLRLDDATGVITGSGLPAMIGLLWVGLFADGVAGSGWQLTGINDYLGVSGQGVTGLFAASGYQVDFPGQLQAQIVGILAVGLWGFVAGMLFCAPLALLMYGLRQSAASAPTRVAAPPEMLEASLVNSKKPLPELNDGRPAFLPRDRTERR